MDSSRVKKTSSAPSKVRKLRDGGELSLRRVHLGAGQSSQTSGRLSLTFPLGPSRVEKPSPSFKASLTQVFGPEEFPSVSFGADYELPLKSLKSLKYRFDPK